MWRSLRKAASTTSRIVNAITVLVGGSVVAAAFFALERPAFGILALTFIVALVLLEGAFRLEHEAATRARKLDARLASKARSDDFRERIAGFLGEGNDLRVELDHAIAERSSLDVTFVCQRMDEWGERVESYLGRESPHMIPLWRREPDEGLPPRLPESEYFQAWIVARIGRLEAILVRLN